ncbi:MAG TPA: cytochrome c oxidase assembly protein [Stellaceae bacterium]|nr:cytochrome c oxidase assembly protein [Stellaceae bacterium]
MYPLWNRWDWSPGILIPLALFAVLYAAGLRRRRGRPGRGARHAAFFGALFAVFAALCSPLDDLSEHLFWVHQVQHLILAMLVPILIMLAAPQAVLIAGLPAPLRHRLLPRLITSAPVRVLFGALTHPAVATALLMAALDVWQIPRLHNAALEDGALHEAMHASMLAAGLLFWWRVLDRRPPPVGAAILVRLWMLEIAWMMDSFIGAYLLSKETVLYDAYDHLGLVVSAMADEALGGAVIWVGESLAFISAGLIVARRAMRQAATIPEPGHP